MHAVVRFMCLQTANIYGACHFDSQLAPIGTYGRVLQQLELVHKALNDEKRVRLQAESEVVVARMEGERAGELRAEVHGLRWEGCGGAST